MREFNMMRFTAMCFAVASGPALSQEPPIIEAPMVQAELEQIKTQLKQEFAGVNAPGMITAIVYGDDIIWRQSFGRASIETGAEIGPDTVFRIGSITKLFTATMLMQLRDEGALRLDQSAENYLPVNIRNPFSDPRPLTFKHLVSHTSGLPPEGGDYWQTGDFPSIRTLVETNRDIDLQNPPLQSLTYSNFGFALLGDALARIAETPYKEYLSQNIFEPLNMENTRFSPAEYDTATIATGYRPTSNGFEQIAHVDIGALAPAGQAYSTVNDLAKFVSLHFKAGAESSDPLKPYSLREMHQPVFISRKISTSAPVGFAIGVGWFIREINGYHAVGHGGGAPGFTSDITIVPSLKLGIITLVNAGADPTSINRRALARVVGAMDDTREQQRLARAQFQPEWEQFLGDYDMAGVATLRIEKRGDHMVLIHPADPNGVPGILIPAGESIFVPSGGAAAGQPLTFQFDEERNVEGFEVVGIYVEKV